MTKPSSTSEPLGGDEGRAVERSDASLLRLLRGGNEDAATQLYLRYAHRLRALAKAQSSVELTRREDFDDIVQSAFGSFFRGAARGFYDVPPGEDLWKLLVVITLNKIRTKGAFHRAAKRDVRATHSGDVLFDPPARDDESDESALALLNMVVEEALQKLPPLQQQMAIMRIQGHEVADIAAAVDRSYRTVERGLKTFREVLDRMLRDEEKA